MKLVNTDIIFFSFVLKSLSPYVRNGIQHMSFWIWLVSLNMSIWL